MSVGATTVWNPFGGGFWDTMTSGGGWSGGGGGGGGGFRNTIVVSMGRFLMVSAMPRVASTAPKIRPPWTRTDRIVCPIVRVPFCFDSIRFSNTQLPP